MHTTERIFFRHLAHPDLISISLETAGDNVIEFTPAKAGNYTYTCWMNMIQNHIRVADDPVFERKN